MLGASDKPNMEGFVSLDELRQLLYQPGSFFLGNCHPDHGGSFPIGVKDDRHLFIVSGSRSGKGLTLIVNNLIDWPGGLVCIDPKGENAAITAMRRGTAEAAKRTGTTVTDFVGQNVAVLDPLGCVQGPARALRVKYDPLSDIDIRSVRATEQILSIAEAVVIADDGDGGHFTDGAAIILAGVIELVLVKDSPDTPTLRRCLELITSGFKTLKNELKQVKTPSGLAQDSYSLIEDAGDDEAGSFRTTLSRQLRWMADPRMQNHLQGDGFSLRKIIRENGSVYICIPPLMIPRMKRWLRCVVQIAMATKMELGPSNKRQQMLFMLDEFPALENFKLIEDAAGYMAGYGIKLVPVIQNIGQIKKLYDKNWETFLSNAGAIVGWGFNDHETETYFSNRMGQRRSWEKSIGVTTQPFLPIRRGASKNWAWQDRPLRMPNEIHAQGAREEMRGFVITAKGAPYTVQRVAYGRAENEGKFDSEAAIAAWEANYRQRRK